MGTCSMRRDRALGHWGGEGGLFQPWLPALWQGHSRDKQQFSCLQQHPQGTCSRLAHSGTGASARPEGAAWERELIQEPGVPPCRATPGGSRFLQKQPAAFLWAGSANSQHLGVP